MLKLVTYLRLPLLALAASFALTSCFDHDKKCDPQPSSAGKCPSHPTTTTSGNGNT